MGTPKRELKDGRSNLVYRFQSEGAPPIKMRLKIEINSRKHFSDLGLANIPFRVDSRWFSGAANVTTFALDELLGTKLRALYQRKKGRDLFDLWMAFHQGIVNARVLVGCFNRYMTNAGHSVTRAQFEENLHDKSSDAAFRGDIGPLIRPGFAWDFDQAFRVVSEQLIALLPGEPWKGRAPDQDLDSLTAIGQDEFKTQCPFIIAGFVDASRRASYLYLCAVLNEAIPESAKRGQKVGHNVGLVEKTIIHKGPIRSSRSTRNLSLSARERT